MVINPIVGVYIPTIRIPYYRWDDHPWYSVFWPWHMWLWYPNMVLFIIFVWYMYTPKDNIAPEKIYSIVSCGASLVSTELSDSIWQRNHRNTCEQDGSLSHNFETSCYWNLLLRAKYVSSEGSICLGVPGATSTTRIEPEIKEYKCDYKLKISQGSCLKETNQLTGILIYILLMSESLHCLACRNPAKDAGNYVSSRES